MQRGDATCLVVSHRRTALAHADHIVVMKDGRIETEGTVDQLLATSTTFQELWYGDESPALTFGQKACCRCMYSQV